MSNVERASVLADRLRELVTVESIFRRRAAVVQGELIEMRDALKANEIKPQDTMLRLDTLVQQSKIISHEILGLRDEFENIVEELEALGIVKICF